MPCASYAGRLARVWGKRVFTRTAVAMATSTRRSLPDGGLSQRESLDFELLFLLETEPGLSQRAIAERLGVSLGRVNYCLKALLEKGELKLAHFRSAKSKLGYAYALTPKGVAERAALTRRFLQRKLAQYDRLKAQIASLERVLNSVDAE